MLKVAIGLIIGFFLGVFVVCLLILAADPKDPTTRRNHENQ